MAITQKSQIQQVLADIQSRWGDRALRPARDLMAAPRLLPTGIPRLDDLIGGGLPVGALSAVIGTATSGGVTLSLTLIARTQADNGEAVFIDLPQTFNAASAADCGVAVDRLLVARPPDALAAFALARDVAASRAVDLVVIDLGLSSAPGAAVDRLLPTLHTAPAAVLVLGTAPPRSAALLLRFTCDRWLMGAWDVIGCRVQAELLAHPRRPAGAQTQFNLRFALARGDTPC